MVSCRINCCLITFGEEKWMKQILYILFCIYVSCITGLNSFAIWQEHLIGLSDEGLEDTPKPLLVKDQTTISRLEKQAEEFLNAVLCRKGESGCLINGAGLMHQCYDTNVLGIKESTNKMVDVNHHSLCKCVPVITSPFYTVCSRWECCAVILPCRSV